MSGGVTLQAGVLGSVTLTAELLNDMVADMTAQVDEGAVGMVELADGSIPAAKLDPTIQQQLGVEDGSVTTAKLAAGCFSADAEGRAKMADGFVTGAELAAGAVIEAKLAANAVTAAKLAAAVVTANVQNAVLTNAFTLASGAWRDTGLSVTITPRRSTSKIWLMAMVHGSSDDWNTVGLRFVCNGSAIGVGDAVGSRLQCGAALATGAAYNYAADYGGSTAGMSFMHAHGVTTALTFKVQAYHASATIYINRSMTDGDSEQYPRGVSTLIAVEV
jgi:hypothetical protein